MCWLGQDPYISSLYQRSNSEHCYFGDHDFNTWGFGDISDSNKNKSDAKYFSFHNYFFSPCSWK